MDKSFSKSYEQAGVDITAGYKSVELIKKDVRSTFTKGVLSDIGGFGGLFKPDITNMKEPILVSGTDGVGTKLKLAFLMDKHNTIGQDCVAMCVNDIVCAGAMPLFFLDYIALGKNVPEVVAEIVSGVAEGCRLAGCSLIGGETAEMPGFYAIDEYDLAGFSVGMVDKEKILNSENVKVGDKVIGIASSGVHSNGFSLVRKIFNINKENVNEYKEELGQTLGETLLTPTKIYVKQILNLIKEVNVKSLSNITGGGFYENIPRALNDSVSVEIKKDAYEIPAIFKLLQKEGNIPEKDMYNTFNMGIGMVAIVSTEDAQKTIKVLEQQGEKAYILGDVIEGTKEVILV